MKQIIDIYGRFLLAGAVLVLLAGLLLVGITDENGNKGMLRIAGARIAAKQTDEKEYIDFKEGYQNESKRAAPIILYEGRHLKTGWNRLSDSIKAYDDAGRELKIRVTSIIDMSGTEWIEQYLADTSEFYFETQGIYTIGVSAIAENRKETVCRIRIPVNF